jgi:hypothetical protein
MRDSTSFSRRAFLGHSTRGAAALGAAGLGGLGDFSFLAGLNPVSAAEAAPQPSIVRFTADVEPLVRLLEDTPRDAVLEKVADRIRGGASYRQVLAALQLAGIRNVQPRPSVGFKFHAVLVVNSAHLASINSPDEHRWLPILWAIDNFKESQARDVREGNWTMSAVDESKVPSAEKAVAEWTGAMDDWDEERADGATAAMVRSRSIDELFQLFCRYGARDFRSIGHKIIFCANGFRTLAAIGREHAEPLLRSLAYAMLNHDGKGNPAKNDFEADRPWRENLARAKKIDQNWRAGKTDEQATKDLLSTFYAGSSADVCDQIVELLNRGVAPQSIWDAMFLEGGELLMRQPGIVGLHTLTTTNAMRYAYDTTTDDETRRMLLLQNGAFLTMFREAMRGRGKVADRKILELEPAVDSTDGDETKSAETAGIFRSIGDPLAAARRTLATVRTDADAEAFIDAARLLVFLKGRDSHDYKFSSAVLEDYAHLSPAWRGRFLAASVFNLKGSQDKDNPLVARAREALTA